MRRRQQSRTPRARPLRALPPRSSRFDLDIARLLDKSTPTKKEPHAQATEASAVMKARAAIALPSAQARPPAGADQRRSTAGGRTYHSRTKRDLRSSASVESGAAAACPPAACASGSAAAARLSTTARLTFQNCPRSNVARAQADFNSSERGSGIDSIMVKLHQQAMCNAQLLSKQRSARRAMAPGAPVAAAQRRASHREARRAAPDT